MKPDIIPRSAPEPDTTVPAARRVDSPVHPAHDPRDGSPAPTSNGAACDGDASANGSGHHVTVEPRPAERWIGLRPLAPPGDGHAANGNRHASYRDGLARNGSGHGSNGHGAVLALELVGPVANGHGAHAVTAPWAGIEVGAPAGLYQRLGKRCLDVVGALVGFVLLGPLMLLFALLVKLDSRGPVLYKSTRLGRDGRPFTFYKFRSMYVGADRDRDGLLHMNQADGPVFKLQRDPRTTRIGRFMRQTSIDELPQFYNVLKGEMSLVGPRPPLPSEVEKYEAWQRHRLDVKPGLTCLWQISGRSRLGFNEWMRLDLEYIRRQSFSTDVRIILRTIPAVLSRDGAY